MEYVSVIESGAKDQNKTIKSSSSLLANSSNSVLDEVKSPVLDKRYHQSLLDLKTEESPTRDTDMAKEMEQYHQSIIPKTGKISLLSVGLIGLGLFLLLKK